MKAWLYFLWSQTLRESFAEQKTRSADIFVVEAGATVSTLHLLSEAR